MIDVYCREIIRYFISSDVFFFTFACSWVNENKPFLMLFNRAFSPSMEEAETEQKQTKATNGNFYELFISFCSSMR